MIKIHISNTQKYEFTAAVTWAVNVTYCTFCAVFRDSHSNLHVRTHYSNMQNLSCLISFIHTVSCTRSLPARPLSSHHLLLWPASHCRRCNHHSCGWPLITRGLRCDLDKLRWDVFTSPGVKNTGWDTWSWIKKKDGRLERRRFRRWFSQRKMDDVMPFILKSFYFHIISHQLC